MKGLHFHQHTLTSWPAPQWHIGSIYWLDILLFLTDREIVYKTLFNLRKPVQHAGSQNQWLCNTSMSFNRLALLCHCSTAAVAVTCLSEITAELAEQMSVIKLTHICLHIYINFINSMVKIKFSHICYRALGPKLMKVLDQRTCIAPCMVYKPP